MSAFCGIYQLDSKPLEKVKLDAITKTLALWEPDKRYQWVKENLGVSQWLRYHTPEAVYATFPTINNHNHYLLASNTRLDNRNELVDQFNINPMEARQLSDEEFILRAYEKWQEDCSKHLLGDFAFVIWDANKQQLFLSRDQIGHCKTIYYYHKPNHLFLFGSSIRPIYEHPDIQITLNEEVLAKFLTFGEQFCNETFYQHIHRLPVGHNLIVSHNHFIVQQYWKWPYRHKIRYKNDQEYVDHFNDIFHQAVKTRLRSYTKIGSHLSGGLDSSSVVAVAANILQKTNQKLYAFGAIPPPNTKLIIPKHFIANESKYMDSVANCYENIMLSKVIDKTPSIISNLNRYHQYAESPCQVPTNRLWLENINNLCVQQNIRNLLCAPFGNDSISFDGIGSHPRLIVAIDTIKKYLNTMKVLINHFRGTDPWHQISPINSLFANQQNMIWFFLKKLSIQPVTLNYSSYKLPTELGHLNSADEAIFGVESRDPTSDLNILCFCSNIPNDQYCQVHDHKLDTRLLIKRAMQERLPTRLLNRKSIGIQDADWLDRYTKEHTFLLTSIQIMLESSFAMRYFDIGELNKILLESADQDSIKKWDTKIYLNYRKILYGIITDLFIRNYFFKG